MDDKMKHLAKVFKPLEPDFDRFTKTYITPIFSIGPTSIKKYLEEVTPAATGDFAQLMVKILLHGNLQELMQTSSLALKIVDKKLKTGSFAVSKTTLENFREGLSLEMENEVYFIRKYGELMLSSGIINILADQLDPKPIIETSVRLYLALIAFLEGISRRNKAIEPVLEELGNICLQYAEEKDTQLESIDILLDKKKRSDLEEAYSEFQKVVGSV